MGSIRVRILGDYGPFSRIGKSVGYQVTVGASSYLIDCGAPLFQQIGGHGLKEIKGVIITHCHDDHKRWFSDLALFHLYSPDFADKVNLITSEDVYNELLKATAPSLDRSLSKDSRRVIDIGFEEYVNYHPLGPKARYRIVSLDEGEGRNALRIVDRDGNLIGPERAKIVISPKTGRPRMLFKDPEYNEWVEPESFYPFSSDIFYEEDKNVHTDPEGFTIEAIKAPVWHGITAIGIVIKTDRERLLFSSDTVHDRGLWERLYKEKLRQRLGMPREEFERASVIYGDINDYIERIWSEARYREAVNVFNEGVVIHDISTRDSIVHTDYDVLPKAMFSKDRVLLTHSPDTMTSELPLCDGGKTFQIRDGRVFEIVEGKLYPMNADIYHKDGGRYYVGYRSKKGRYVVYRKDGMLGLARRTEDIQAEILFYVDLYEDIGGRYYPKIEDDSSEYRVRRDGRVELVEYTDSGSKGVIVENERDKLKTGINSV